MNTTERVSHNPNALPKLKPGIKKRWLKALRSGKYKQGREKLRDDDDGYCCLGVLCDVVKKDKGLNIVDGWTWTDDSGGLTPCYGFGGAETALPHNVSLYVTADSVAGSDWWAPLIVRNDGGEYSLADSFDDAYTGRPQSFKVIANLIERHM